MTDPIRIRRDQGLSLSLTTQGAAWLSCEVPMPDGSLRSVILQRKEPADAAVRAAYLGATVGRYANRIAQGHIAFEGRSSSLATQPGSRHHLHGGPLGFHAREWQVQQIDEASVCFSIVSAEGDQGYPGELRAQVTYRLSDAMTIEMESVASVTAACPVCITNHAYFNLDDVVGDARGHRLQVQAPRYLPVDAELIPLGMLAEVQDTGFDFREPKTLQADWLCDAQQRQAGGYDHAFLLDASCADLNRPAAVLESADGALTLEISTSLPALQLYGGQYLGGVPTPSGALLPACPGIALEPQFLPDSPNHPEWPQPSCWLRPGEVYRQRIRYRFSAARAPA